MVWSKQVKWINGNFTLAGHSADELAEKYGTPAFLLDEDDFRSRAREFQTEFSKAFGEGNVSVFYAGKAFLATRIANWLAEDGLSLDVCTGGELAVAKAVNFPAERIEFHGNNKSEEEIADAIDYGVALIALDSFIEIERVQAIASSKNKIQKVIIRTTPGIEAHTHEFIATAHEDVKFGFSIASGAAKQAAQEVLRSSNLELVGFHAHIGSQIFDTKGHQLTAERILKLMAEVKQLGANIDYLDLGGGFGVAYTESDQPMQVSEIAQTLFAFLRDECKKYSIPIPHIAIEPGRAIAAPSMTTIYRVGTVKNVVLENGKTRQYVSVDGGMSDNIRTSLYDAVYSVALASTHTGDSIPSRVVGKHCESGDVVVKDVELPADIKVGDLLLTPVTGAYGRSMASNYNHVPRPPVIAVRADGCEIVVRRETYADLLRLDGMEK